jgi:hypothetical protein
MKNLNKTLLAAALMVAAGSANAALTNTTLTGANEAYLVAYDAGYQVAGVTVGRSFNLDLGTTFGALQANAGTALAAFVGATNNLVGNADWSTFTGLGATSLITYGVYAAGDTATQANNGVFVTGGLVAPLVTAGTTPAGSTTTWGAAIGAINGHAVEINTGAFTTSSVVKGTDQIASGQANSVPDFTTLWGTSSVDPTAAYGSSTGFYYGATHLGSVVARGKTTTGVALLAASDISLAGTFTLTGNTLSFQTPSQVPLPAAVWMFGAGLMGVLRLNRRKSVQA